MTIVKIRACDKGRSCIKDILSPDSQIRRRTSDTPSEATMIMDTAASIQEPCEMLNGCFGRRVASKVQEQ